MKSQFVSCVSFDLIVSSELYFSVLVLWNQEILRTSMYFKVLKTCEERSEKELPIFVLTKMEKAYMQNAYLIFLKYS